MLYYSVMSNIPSPGVILHGLNASLDAKLARMIELNAVNQKLFTARQILMKAKNDILNEYNDTSKHPDGLKELGSNETVRSASLDTMTVKERSAVDELEQQQFKSQNELAMAQVECDRWRYTLRIAEIDARINTSAN